MTLSVKSPKGFTAKVLVSVSPPKFTRKRTGVTVSPSRANPPNVSSSSSSTSPDPAGTPTFEGGVIGGRTGPHSGPTQTAGVTLTDALAEPTLPFKSFTSYMTLYELGPLKIFGFLGVVFRDPETDDDSGPAPDQPAV